MRLLLILACLPPLRFTFILDQSYFDAQFEEQSRLRTVNHNTIVHELGTTNSTQQNAARDQDYGNGSSITAEETQNMMNDTKLINLNNLMDHIIEIVFTNSLLSGLM